MLTNLIISVISGVVGGNAMAAVQKTCNLGLVRNSIAGAIGGAGAGEALSMFMGPGGAAPLAGMANTAGSSALSGLLTAIIAGGVGGGILTGMIAMAKKMRKKMMGGE